MTRFVSALLASAVVFAALLPSCQRRLLYLPDTEAPSEAQLAALGMAFWPQSENHRGFVGLARLEQARGTVLVFHGNAGSAWQRSYYVDALQARGYRVVLAEYPGYGGRPGKPGEQSLVTDGMASLQVLRERFGEPVYLWGESLGAGVVAAMSHHSEIPVPGLVLLTPWDSLYALAGTHFPVLPPRFILRDRYDSVANLADFQGSVAVLVAEEDDIVPDRHSMTLYESLQARKRLWRFTGAGHNSWPAAPGEAWWAEVMDFIAAPGST